MSAIERCRTVALGGHVPRFENCAQTVIPYNSCRNPRVRYVPGWCLALWWYGLGRVPPGVLSAVVVCPALVRPFVAGQAPRGPPVWTSRFFGRRRRASRAASIRCLPRAAAQGRAGGR